MASAKAFTDVPIAAAPTWTTIDVSGSSPCSVENVSDAVITLRAGGAGATRDLSPGQRVDDVPAGAQLEAQHAGSGSKTVQVLRSVVPGQISAVPGGSVGAAGSVAVGGHRGLWSVLQGDFTAAYASVTTLTLGTFPTALGAPDDENFVMVVVTDSAGAQRAYFPQTNPMTLSGAVLTVAGASFDAGDTAYDVFVWGPPKSYDATLNADQVRLLNPAWLQLLPLTLVDATNITDGTVYYPLTFEGYLFGGFQLALDCDAGTVTATLEASYDSTATEGTATYQDVTNDLFGVASLVSAAAPISDIWAIDTPFAPKFMRIKIVYATGGNTGDATVDFRGAY